MTQVRPETIKIIGAEHTEGPSTSCKGALPCCESYRSGEALDPIPTLDISVVEEPINNPPSRHTLLQQAGQDATWLTTNEFYPYDRRVGRGRERDEQMPWRVPHNSECQKRMWHHSSLGMGTKHVGDEWGFSSTGVSRSQSPSNISVPQSAKEIKDAVDKEKLIAILGLNEWRKTPYD